MAILYFICHIYLFILLNETQGAFNIRHRKLPRVFVWPRLLQLSSIREGNFFYLFSAAILNSLKKFARGLENTGQGIEQSVWLILVICFLAA